MTGSREPAGAWDPRTLLALDDEGSAIVEFVTLGVLLLLPVLYLIGTLGRIQAGAFAAEAGSRAAARAYILSPDDASGIAAAHEVARLAADDQGFPGGQTSVRVTCSTDPCLRPEGRVTVRMQIEVGLPMVPGFLAGAVPLQIPVESTSTAVVGTYVDPARPGTGDGCCGPGTTPQPALRGGGGG